MDRERFAALVDEAVESLPPEWAARLDNVEVVVEEAPSPALLRSMGLGRGGTLLGLYQGVPQTRRGPHYGLVLPDRIVIYRRPVLASIRVDPALDARYGQAVRRQVCRTVLHELGHHFGVGEADLRRLGY